MQQTSLAARAAELRSELNYHNLRYYQMDDPVISDGQYDALLRELQDIEREQPELQTATLLRCGLAETRPQPSPRYSTPGPCSAWATHSTSRNWRPGIAG